MTTMGDGGASSMKKDIVSAYIATAARILSWVILSGIVYRQCRPRYFAMLMLVRATIGLLSNATVGLGPAMVFFLSRKIKDVPKPAIPIPDYQDNVLDYAAPGRPPKKIAPYERVVYVTGDAIAACAGVIAIALTVLYGDNFFRIHDISWGPSLDGEVKAYHEAQGLVFWMGVGMTLRLVSEPLSALLQTHGKIWLDNCILAACELLWLATGAAMLFNSGETAIPVALCYSFASLGVFVARKSAANRIEKKLEPQLSAIDWRLGKRMLGFGLMVMAAQLADFLYAPTDYVLITRLMNSLTVATYAPAVQIDAAILVLVTGLAAVLLPKAALAHGAGDARTLRIYYFKGTLSSILMLLAAAGTTWIASPFIFRLWLGDSMPATRAILPLVLIHTVVGGSSAVGRSILLGMGKVKAFTIAVLVAGISNVILSYCFVVYLNLGLVGIILGTIVVVVARCAIWMPWYVNKSLREAHGQIPLEEPAPALPVV